jgi:NAD dependent epimerase/dehydratase family enzyme
MSNDHQNPQPQHVLVTGATGFIGSSLVLALRRRGHRVTALVRDEKRARDTLGAEVKFISTGVSDQALAQAMSQFDAVINLAGAPVAQRWTESRRKAIVDSRVGLTQRLVAAMGAATRTPPTLVSASAVGVYGDRGDEELNAQSSPGPGWLAQLSLDWEGA